MYPSVLKKGTIIRINRRPNQYISSAAIGLEFELRKDVRISDSGEGIDIHMCSVVKDPNNWGNQVYHEFDLNYDTIVINTKNNKEAAKLLEKEW